MPSDKKTARRNGLKARSRLSEAERHQKDERIRLRVIEKIAPYEVIGCYVSMKDEVSTIAILEWCFLHGKTAAVPKVTGDSLVFHRIHGFDDLAPGTYGVLEPVKDDPVPVEDIEFMIVPLSAFDGYHNRTGYGKGYYDSVLKRCRHSVGLAYDVQKTDLIITDPWDVRLDEIICE